MDAANQVRLREVQLVVATVNEDALGIEDCAHSAVTEEGGIFKASKKVGTHSNQNTREMWPVPDREGMRTPRFPRALPRLSSPQVAIIQSSASKRLSHKRFRSSQFEAKGNLSVVVMRAGNFLCLRQQQSEHDPDNHTAASGANLQPDQLKNRHRRHHQGPDCNHNFRRTARADAALQ